MPHHKPRDSPRLRAPPCGQVAVKSQSSRTGTHGRNNRHQNPEACHGLLSPPPEALDRNPSGEQAGQSSSWMMGISKPAMPSRRRTRRKPARVPRHEPVPQHTDTAQGRTKKTKSPGSFLSRDLQLRGVDLDALCVRSPMRAVQGPRGGRTLCPARPGPPCPVRPWLSDSGIDGCIEGQDHPE